MLPGTHLFPRCAFLLKYSTEFFTLWIDSAKAGSLPLLVNFSFFCSCTFFKGSNIFVEKTLEGPLNCKEVKAVHPKGDQSWVFIGRTDAEAETPILWSPDVKSWLIGWDPDAGKDWGQEEKGITEDGMVGWHHWLHEYEFEQAPGVGDGQGSLVCCSAWGHKESDRTERLNWTETFSRESQDIFKVFLSFFV